MLKLLYKVNLYEFTISSGNDYLKNATIHFNYVDENDKKYEIEFG